VKKGSEKDAALRISLGPRGWEGFGKKLIRGKEEQDRHRDFLEARGILKEWRVA